MRKTQSVTLVLNYFCSYEAPDTDILETFPAGMTELFFNGNPMYNLQSEKEKLFLVIPNS
jgi:hypothetical protein